MASGSSQCGWVGGTGWSDARSTAGTRSELLTLEGRHARLSRQQRSLTATVRNNEGMLLPVMPPVAPMLAKSVPQIPEGSLSFEPKWDGFRSIVFRDGGEVEIGSRNERPMTRYFPEVVEAIKQSMPERCVVDGEIIVVVGDRLEFEVLQQRIHPAASRIKLLSEETPARFVAFDLLALDDIAYTHEPFEKRRSILEEALANAQPPIHLTPATRDHDLAKMVFAVRRCGTRRRRGEAAERDVPA